MYKRCHFCDNLKSDCVLVGARMWVCAKCFAEQTSVKLAG